MKIIGIDNQEETIKKLNRKKVVWATSIGIIVIILITVFCVYVAHKPFRDFIDKYVLMKNVTENNVTSIAIDENQNTNIYAYDKYISVFSENTLVRLQFFREKEYELTVEIANPIIDTNNRFLLMAEKEKQKIYLISGDKIVWQKELEGNISRISVNKNGYVSVILTGTTYKSVIQTFDANGKEMFKTYLSSSIAMDSDISQDNKYLSFAEISTNGTLVQALIKTISIQKAQGTPSEAIISTINVPRGNIPTNIKYQEGNRLICMYDNTAIYCIQNEKEENILSLNEEGKRTSFGGIELNNFAFRVIEKSALLSTESSVEIMNIANKKMNIYTIEGSIKEIYCYEDIIALNLGSEVHFIGTNGWLIKKYTSSHEVRKIVISSNLAGIVYRDKIEIVNL